MNYLEDIRIDETALDIEWLRQPELMLKYGSLAVEARMNMDLEKEVLELVKAKLDKEIRENPEKFGISKLTENVVQNIILLQDEYKEQNKKYLNAKYNYEVLKVVVDSLNQKRDSLENLVKLFGLQYFSGPKEPRDLLKEKQNFEINRKIKINQNLKTNSHEEE